MIPDLVSSHITEYEARRARECSTNKRGDTVKLTREVYLRVGAQAQPSDNVPIEKAICYTYVQSNGHTVVVCFIGKQSKPAKTLCYRTHEEAMKTVAAFYRNVAEVGEYKKEQKQKQLEKQRQAKAEFEGKIGSIFVASWGYEQTNVDAYQITARLNNQTVEVVEVGTASTGKNNGFSAMADNVKPVPVSAEIAATLPKLKARITSKNTIQVGGKRSSGNADLWDGERDYYNSWYG
jgi:hypothetical protein